MNNVIEQRFDFVLELVAFPESALLETPPAPPRAIACLISMRNEKLATGTL